jgi:hypothetical protein
MRPAFYLPLTYGILAEKRKEGSGGASLSLLLDMQIDGYFAYSMARVSRITCTLI